MAFIVAYYFANPLYTKLTITNTYSFQAAHLAQVNKKFEELNHSVEAQKSMLATKDTEHVYCL